MVIARTPPVACRLTERKEQNWKTQITDFSLIFLLRGLIWADDHKCWGPGKLGPKRSCLYKQTSEERRDKWHSKKHDSKCSDLFYFCGVFVPSFCLCVFFLLFHCLGFNSFKPFNSKEVPVDWPLLFI